ncbi:EVE domain-containing protein [Candidatus Babeliales bacterium]|nr:EVE domain-containing protein [Candidatus Babeliales bacterium]MBP9844359.1 EVE domain-containing protein [Candidatus Babeliales bacterium]
MTKYWVGVASREHVKKGVTDGIAQVCHGKQGPLKRMQQGDWIIYYSPVEIFGGKQACRKFTAIGQVQAGESYQFEMSPDFIPWRRDVQFMQAHDAAIEPLINQLTFIENKIYWGFKFRFGLFEIKHHDFLLIAQNMGMNLEK